MQKLDQCPVCGYGEHREVRRPRYFRQPDGASFTIVECHRCGFWFTNPRPEGSDLAQYYETEDYISHTDRKEGLFDQIYHLVRNIALRKKRKLVQNLTGENGRILDFGAGTGAFVLTMQQAGWTAVGVEPDQRAREAGEKKGVSLQSDAFFESTLEKYDVITLWHVLEHVPDLNQKLQQFYQRLNPGGSLVLALPNHNSFDARFYKDYWAALDIPLHLSHFVQEDIRNLADKHKFRYQASLNMPFDAFYVSMLSEKNRPGKTQLLRALAVAGLSNLKGCRSANMSSLIHVLRKGEDS